MKQLELLCGQDEWIEVDVRTLTSPHFQEKVIDRLKEITFEKEYNYFVRLDVYGGSKLQLYREIK